MEERRRCERGRHALIRLALERRAQQQHCRIAVGRVEFGHARQDSTLEVRARPEGEVGVEDACHRQAERLAAASCWALRIRQAAAQCKRGAASTNV